MSDDGPKVDPDEFIRVVVAAAPPFTEEQKRELVRLLAPILRPTEQDQ